MYPGNPVLTPSQAWDSGWVATPDVLYDGGIYKMWYQGCVQTCSIGYAVSTDGITWTPYAGNPVVAANASSWDTYVYFPQVIHDSSGYRMWYAANGPLGIRVGYATSSDGVHWTKYGNAPIFNGTGSWDQVAVVSPTVAQVGSSYVMIFAGTSGGSGYAIGQATSSDGVHWMEYAGNPIMAAQAPWEQPNVVPSHLTYGPSGYDMYYDAGTVSGGGGVGRASSSTGLVWTRDSGNPLLRAGTPGTWDGTAIGGGSPISVGSQRRLYCVGYNQSVLQIGFATGSPTGFTYLPSGSWVSEVFDSGNPNTTWSSLTWTGTTPAGTAVGASLFVGNTSVPGSTWSLSPPSAASPASLHLPEARYARLIVALVSTNSSQTPTISSIAVAYEVPAASSPAFSYWGLGLIGFWLFVALLVGVVAVFLVVILVWRPPGPMPGASLARPLACPRCGSSVPPGYRFCETCGFEVSPPGGAGPPLG